MQNLFSHNKFGIKYKAPAIFNPHPPFTTRHPPFTTRHPPFTISALCFLLCCFLFVDAAFQRCEEISVSLFDSQNNVSFTAIFHVSRSNTDKNVVTYKQFSQSANIQQFQKYANFLKNTDLTLTNGSLCVNKEMQCFQNSSDAFTVDDGMLSIAVIFNQTEDDYEIYYSLFYGYMNEASFIFYDGSMFSENNKCLEYADIDMNLWFGQPFWQYKTCCTSFQPAKPVTDDTPKCTNFNISSTLFNITENTIIATTATDFKLSENNFIGKGTFSLNYSPFEIEFLYAINIIPCQWSSRNIQYCHFPINGEDRTLMFYVRQEPTIDPLALAGKLIIRNGQTLIKEGVPFSSTNMCENFTQPLIIRSQYGGDLLNWTVNVLSQFCCTAFENSNPTSPTPPILSASNITAQKCKNMQTSAAFNTLNINMSASLNVKNFNDTINIINVENLKIYTSLNHSNFKLCIDEFVNGGPYTCKNIENSVEFAVNNNPIKLRLKTFLHDSDDEPYDPPLFIGMIDHGSFISYDGLLFDLNKQKCSTFNDNVLTVTSCCTSFNQTTSSNPVSHPSCKNFKATSTLYNTTDNNSVYVTASANFVLNDTDIIAIGDFTQYSAPLYSINGYRFGFGFNGTQFGGFPLKSLNSELLIHLSFYQNSLNHDSIFVGRIILFEGQTFIDQNVPYTTSNNCYNFTAPYFDYVFPGIKVESQFCCTDFTDFGLNTTPHTSSSTSSLTKLNSNLTKTFVKMFLFIIFWSEFIAI